jgi:hypothetical protein
MSTNYTWGDRSGLLNDRALPTSPLTAYSRQERTPWRNSILIVGCALASDQRRAHEADVRVADCARALRRRPALKWGHERDADRLERSGRQRLRRQACPKTVAVTCHGRKAHNPVVPNEIVDFAALDVRRAEVTAAESGNQ